MKRVDAKPKRKLKNPWGKVRRHCEAIIELNVAQLESA